jgi:ATP-binding cassette subfamily B protein/subfamily B ATP-binding cassette protein MsbA
LYLTGRASVGDIVACQWYANLLSSPIIVLANNLSELHRSLAGTERLFDILSRPIDKPDRPDAIAAPSEVNELYFEKVTFQYTGDRSPVVKDFTLLVMRGSVVAIVGPSGSGKTTLTDLLARFHDPTTGRISLNGTDISAFTLASYRKLIAHVHQDVFLFDGSIRDNIAYGRPTAPNDEIRKAAESANAHDFISRLPHQYDTLIGERGVQLSGGQRQRIAIARAILASAKILILDEATSNLDSESEHLVQTSMPESLRGCTVFVVAHRLSTIRGASLIVFLKEGEIVETGTHRDLMNRRGAYYRMVIHQTLDAQVIYPEPPCASVTRPL